MIKCVFYGSLRKPMYNYNKLRMLYGLDSMQYIKTTPTCGYEMYTLGSYPAIKESSQDRTIIVDLFKVNEEAYKYIQEMETGADFYEDNIIIDGEEYSIFPYAGRVNEHNLIVYGDWVRYSNNYASRVSIN